MSISPEQLNQAIRAIEVQLDILKRAAGLPASEAEVGVVGTFDGEFMVQEDGKRFQIPPNYASKSMLVPGDTIRMIEDPNGGPAKFKQIGKAERLKSTGILARKDGKFEVLTEEGSFKVLSAAIKHYEGEVGDSVTIQFPKNHTKGSWAAVEKVVKANAQPSGITAIPAPAPLASTASPIQHAAAPTEPVAEQLTSAPVVAAASSVPTQVVEPLASSPVLVPPVEAPVVQSAGPQPPKPEVSQRPARPTAATDKKPPVRSDSKSTSSRTDRPKPTTDRPADRRTTDRPAPSRPSTPMSRTPRTETPAPRPRTEPAPQPIIPGDTGEISVSAVMDEDDLM